MMEEQKKPSVAVVGAGISGLTAAKKLMGAGYDVTVIEGSPRAGGKIKSKHYDDGRIADAGAEFIDSTHIGLLDLARELDVPIEASLENLDERFQLPNGEMMSGDEFAAAYAPIAEQVAQDKQAIIAEPNGERAQQLDAMSTKAYIEDLARRANDAQKQSWLEWFTLREAAPAVTDDVAATAISMFASETGRPSDHISALQFVNESAEDGVLLDSDVEYRVAGGTQALTDALRRKLEEGGAAFHYNAKVQSVSKDQGKFGLTAQDGQILDGYDQVVMATQAHTLAKIDGLDKLGFAQDDLDTLGSLQYTHNTKVTIKTKVPLKEDGFFISSKDYQTWNRVADDGSSEVVFLVGGDLAAKLKGDKLMDFLLDDYAKAHGTTAQELFDKSQMDYHGPNPDAPCYASPAPGQAVKMQQVSVSLEQMASQHGMSAVGTYLPADKPGYQGYGFMANGVDAVDRAIPRLVAHQQSVAAAKGLNYQPEQGQVAGTIPMQSRGDGGVFRS